MPKFNRVSLVGSEELFRPTKVEPEPVEIAPADSLAGRTAEAVKPASPTPPAAPAPAPLSRERQAYRINLTEGQVKLLIEAVQRMKYPHQIHESKPSIESFEELDDLRNHLWDAIS
ncbi:MAG: hypothetical protein ABR598_05025 [Candidatus Dormibacteria bacterium]